MDLSEDALTKQLLDYSQKEINNIAYSSGKIRSCHLERTLGQHDGWTRKPKPQRASEPS